MVINIITIIIIMIIIVIMIIIIIIIVIIVIIVIIISIIIILRPSARPPRLFLKCYRVHLKRYEDLTSCKIGRDCREFFNLDFCGGILAFFPL